MQFSFLNWFGTCVRFVLAMGPHFCWYFIAISYHLASFGNINISIDVRFMQISVYFLLKTHPLCKTPNFV